MRVGAVPRSRAARKLGASCQSRITTWSLRRRGCCWCAVRSRTRRSCCKPLRRGTVRQLLAPRASAVGFVGGGRDYRRPRVHYRPRQRVRQCGPTVPLRGPRAGTLTWITRSAPARARAAVRYLVPPFKITRMMTAAESDQRRPCRAALWRPARLLGATAVHGGGARVAADMHVRPRVWDGVSGRARTIVRRAYCRRLNTR